MRTCKRCKINEAVKGSLNCEKCNKRNKDNSDKLKTELKFHTDPIKKSLANCNAYGGLGREWDKGMAGHLENL